MTVLFKPQARIPLGFATISGVRVPVNIEIEWDRFFIGLFERVGGTGGLGTTDVDAGYFAAIAPVIPPAVDDSMILQPMIAQGEMADVMQPMPAEQSLPDIMQTGGDSCCLGEMIFANI